MADAGSAEWWSAHGERLARRRPRAGGLTIERIVEAAVAILDEVGLDGLTVRELAGRLGTSSATLYRHVASVEELRVLVIDAVLGEVRIPSRRRPPRERITALALELRRVLAAHPGVTPALPAAPLLGPNAQRGTEAGLAAVLELGLPEPIAVSAYLVLIDFVLGSVFFDSSSGTHGGHDGRVLTGEEIVRFGVGAFLDGLLAPTGDTDASVDR